MSTGSRSGDTATRVRAIVPEASPSVLADLDLTRGGEDVRFAPGNRRLAVARAHHDTIVVVDLDIRLDGDQSCVVVTDVVEVSSPHFAYPHGVDWVDDATIVVANRYGRVAVCRLGSGDGRGARPSSVEVVPVDGLDLADGPASVAVAGGAGGRTDIIVCNNDAHTLTRHTLAADARSVTSNRLLLRRLINFPDGVGLTDDGTWIAVSNHQAHVVGLYEQPESLHDDSEPDCVLRGVLYPHGVRFGPGARHVVVADCSAPFVHVFEPDGPTWRGVRYPVGSFRVMDDAVFRLHPRHRLGDGGPKGIDIDRGRHVLAVVAEYQPLAFFDLAAILDDDARPSFDDDRRLQYELDILERTRALEAHVAALKRSVSFRLTRPLRSLKAAWLRMRG